MAIKLTNATATYVIMIVVFAAGLWTILSFGGTLKGAPDLAGEWEFTDTANGTISKTSINQSGSFVQIRIEGSPPVECRLTTDAERAIQLRADSLSLSFQPTAQADVFRVSGTTPSNAALRQFDARIISRTYPRPQSSTRPTTVPSHT